MAVHQDCYGILKIPSGDWFCDPCKRNLNPKDLSCVLCSENGGAFKPVGQKLSNQWAHLTCAMWMPEVAVRTDKSNQISWISGVDDVPEARFNQMCQVCHLRGRGQACTQCSLKTCTKSYHIPCAIKNGQKFRINAELVGKTTIDKKASSTDLFQSFCELHSKEFENELSSPTKKKEIIDVRAATIDEIYNNFDSYSPRFPPVQFNDNEVFGLVKSYWVQKRSFFNEFKPLVDVDIFLFRTWLDKFGEFYTEDVKSWTEDKSENSYRVIFLKWCFRAKKPFFGQKIGF